MKAIVVGVLPQPIGGIATYLRRYFLAEHERIERFIDLYPGAKEPLPAHLAVRVVNLAGPVALILWFWRHWSSQNDRVVEWNFSTPCALLLLLMMPKPRRARWSCMLHHGNLVVPSGPVLRALWRLSLRRMDRVSFLTAAQRGFYRALGVPQEKLQAASSYLTLNRPGFTGE